MFKFYVTIVYLSIAEIIIIIIIMIDDWIEGKLRDLCVRSLE